jgi:acyl-CoA hydrolase
MLSVHDTVTEMVQYVFPQHAGAPGQLYGGRMMEWIVTAGTLAASRVARGPTVLGAMDDLDFLHPVRVGEIAILRARVEWIGRSSLEVGVRVFSEDPATGARQTTLSSHLVFVAIDEGGHPRPVGEEIGPAGPGGPGRKAEQAVVDAARARRHARQARFALRAHRSTEGDQAGGGSSHRCEASRFVFPEDALSGSLMFAGRLLFMVDEMAAILAVRHARAPLATASIDALEFFAPIRVGEMLTFRGGLNRVGSRSMEVGLEVLAEAPLTGERRHTCTAYLTFVKLRASGDGLPALGPASGSEQRHRDAADKRQAGRRARVSALKHDLLGEDAW